jgi:hypothetical protein
VPKLPTILFPLLIAAAAPVQAQLFWKAPEIPGGTLTAPEPGYGQPMPGATPAESRAALVWNLRSAINVAALQCGLNPLLRIPETYNVMIADHRDELAAAFATLGSYYKRKNKTPKAGQTALDQYGTRTYSSFSAVAGLLPFCHVASQTVREAIFTPRGKLYQVAEARLKQLHNSVNFRKGEQQFPGIRIDGRPRLPVLDERCWPKKKGYQASCGWQ